MKNLIKNNIDKFVFFDEERSDLEFTKYWNNAKTHILKYEALQIYNVEEPSYEYYKHGQIASMVDDIVQFWKGEIVDNYKQIYDGKIKFYRLHSIVKPVSVYLQSEYYSYIASEYIGEEIRVIEKNSIDSIELCDFMVFDNSAVMITEYNNNYEPVRDWFSTDPEIIQCISQIYFDVFNKAESYKSMFDSDKKIEDEIINELKN